MGKHLPLDPRDEPPARAPLEHLERHDDVFFATLDAEPGAPLDARSYGVGAANILQLAVQPSGAIIVSGIVLGELRLCDEVLRSEGSADVFVAQLTP